MKTLLIILIALMCGVVAGASLVKNAMRPKWIEAQERARALVQENSRLKNENVAAKEHILNLEAQVTELLIGLEKEFGGAVPQEVDPPMPKDTPSRMPAPLECRSSVPQSRIGPAVGIGFSRLAQGTIQAIL